jgi:hypothetical protein
MIFPLLYYGFGTWSVTPRGKHRQRVFDYRVLRGIFGLQKDEVTKERRRPNIMEVYDMYLSPNIIWVIKSRKMR